MKLFLTALTGLSMAACALLNEPASAPPGMPLDKQHKPFGDERAITRTSTATNCTR